MGRISRGLGWKGELGEEGLAKGFENAKHLDLHRGGQRIRRISGGLAFLIVSSGVVSLIVFPSVYDSAVGALWATICISTALEKGLRGKVGE